MRILLAWMFRNLGIKLIALMLALIIYVHVATDRDQELNFKVPLRLVGLSDTLSLMSPVPKEVLVGFRGKGREIYMALFRGSRAELDLSDAGPGTVRHMFSPRDVKLPVGLNVSVADVVSPETLVVQVDHRIQRRLPVRVIVAAGSPERRLRTEPDSVSVDGPEAILAPLEWVPTEPFPAGGDADHKERLAAVRPASPYLSVSPRQVRVRPAASGS